jgi:eukaryotic-like serine/threonine-protein kinase
MLTLEPGVVIGAKYRLDRALSRGGMGSVWVGSHLLLDVRVAVKFIDGRFTASPDARARFEREAKACARLKSPHIVQVHDYGVEDGTPFLVMELLEGEDLGARLRKAGRLSLADASSFATQIARALRTAHEAGIVHRDLKPGNVFLWRHQDEDVVKLLDFGIGKTIGEARTVEDTLPGAVLGSPRYMSPEQARAQQDIDGRSDLWALGVILYRAVTGRLPFHTAQGADLLVAICADPIPVPSQVAPDLEPDVDRFFARALARDRGQRFQTARELAQAFAALAGDYGEPISITVPPPSSKPGESGLAGQGTLTPAGRSLSAGSLPGEPRSRARLSLVAGAASLGVLCGAGLFLGLRASESQPVAVPEPSAVLAASAAPPAPTPGMLVSPAASASAVPALSASARPKAGSRPDPVFGF